MQPFEHLTFNHLITTRPHEVTQVFISDLHLPSFADFVDSDSHQTPASVNGLMQAFLCLLDDLLALPKLRQLFILGDWFDAWIGDDAYLSLPKNTKLTHPLTPMLNKLSQLSDQGCQIMVMVGNRDFMLTQKFCDTFAGTLIDEPYPLEIGHHCYRLEHGDALCTDDVAYQRLRRVTHNRWVQWGLAKLPLSKRLDIAHAMRQKSQSANQQKSASIMDVNPQAVHHAVKQYDGLIHGHTHRPACHQTADDKQRYVLGDWRLEPQTFKGSRHTVEAVIGAVVQGEGFRLVLFNPTT